MNLSMLPDLSCDVIGSDSLNVVIEVDIHFWLVWRAERRLDV